MKILLVDDSPSIRKMVSTLFEVQDDEVVTAEGGAQAMAMLGQPDHGIQVILLDQMMPGMDGLETFGAIRQIEPELPVIMLTAHSSVALATEFMRQGGADFIEKPFPPGALEARVKVALNNHELQLRVRQAEAGRKAAEEVTRRVRQLLGNLSHSLRTPLSGVIGLLPMAQHALALGEVSQTHRYLDLMAVKQSDFLRLVTNIETLARLEVGHYPVQPEVYDLHRIVTDLANRLRPAFLAEGKILTCEGETDQVTCDASLLEEILIQLLDNARRLSPTAGTVTVRVENDDLGTRVVVLDQGPGIPAGEEENIFDPFTESSRTMTKAGGRGLGLAIVRGLAQLQGWRCQARNREAGGAQFTLYL